MKGLIFRDLMVYSRRVSRWMWVLDAVFFLVFLFLLKNQYSVCTYLLCVLPLNMCGMAAAMKEQDATYKGMTQALLFPFTREQIVTARFLAVFLHQTYYMAVMALFILAHYGIYGSFGLSTYFRLAAAGWLLGCTLNSLNLLAGFIAGVNVTTGIYLGMTITVLLSYLIMMFAGVDIIHTLPFDTAPFWAACAGTAAGTAALSYLISRTVFRHKK